MILGDRKLLVMLMRKFDVMPSKKVQTFIKEFTGMTTNYAGEDDEHYLFKAIIEGYSFTTTMARTLKKERIEYFEADGYYYFKTPKR